MHKRHISPFEYANTIVSANYSGVLLTTKHNDDLNTMAIGWGLLGNVWKRTLFVAYVRTSRYSYQLIDQSGEFTVSIPTGPVDKRIIAVAGRKSKRNIDKFEELGLTLVEPEIVSSPAIAEYPLTLECKVIYKQDLDRDALLPEVIERCYPPHVTDIDTVFNCHCHTAYYGEIVSSYIIEND